MADIGITGKYNGNSKAIEFGLEPGYAEDKWGPWKSHKLLLSEAVRRDQSWSQRAGMYLDFSNLIPYRCAFEDFCSV
jgi:hypothetical protein